MEQQCLFAELLLPPKLAATSVMTDRQFCFKYAYFYCMCALKSELFLSGCYIIKALFCFRMTVV